MPGVRLRSRRHQGGEFEGLGGEVKQAFDDVLGAYFIFDVDEGGTLDKEEVMRQMQSKEELSGLPARPAC